MACGQRLLQNNPTTARCGHLASSYITQAWLCSRWYHLKKTYKSPALLSSQQLPQSFPHLGSKHAAVCMVWAGHPSTGGLIGPASPSRMLQIKTKVCGGSTSAFCCVFHVSLPRSCPPLKLSHVSPSPGNAQECERGGHRAQCSRSRSVFFLVIKSNLA